VFVLVALIPTCVLGLVHRAGDFRHAEEA